MLSLTWHVKGLRKKKSGRESGERRRKCKKKWKAEWLSFFPPFFCAQHNFPCPPPSSPFFFFFFVGRSVGTRAWIFFMKWFWIPQFLWKPSGCVKKSAQYALKKDFLDQFDQFLIQKLIQFWSELIKKNRTSGYPLFLRALLVPNRPTPPHLRVGKGRKEGKVIWECRDFPHFLPPFFWWEQSRTCEK